MILVSAALYGRRSDPYAGRFEGKEDPCDAKRNRYQNGRAFRRFARTYGK